MISDLYLNDGADAGEAVDHDGYEGAIAQAEDIGLAGVGVLLGRLANRDAVEQRAGLLGREHGRLTFLDNVFRAPHCMGWVHVDDVPGDQPVKGRAQRGQVLFDGITRHTRLSRREKRACELLSPASLKVSTGPGCRHRNYQYF